mgnify:FL=1|jgi:serine/threonine-protein kinase
MALTAGDRFGVYQIVTEISAGGMGVVYRARDTRLDRDVAASFTATSSRRRTSRCALTATGCVKRRAPVQP